MQPQAVSVIGGGALGRVVAEMVRASAAFELVGIFDESATGGQTQAGMPVSPLADLIAQASRPAAVIAIGAVAVRRRL